MEDNNSQQPAPSAQQPQVTHLPVDNAQPVPGAAPIEPQAPMGSGQQPQMSDQKKSRKPLLMGVLAGILVFVLGGGYYLFAYLPNTPQNVWRRGMASIGVGLDELGGGETLFMSAATEFDGEINITEPTVFTSTFSGTTTVSGDGEFSLDATWDRYNPELDVYYSLLNAEYPQFFFRFDGVSEIVDDSFGPGSFSEIAGGRSIENVWWLLDVGELVEQGILSEAEVDQLISDAESEPEIATEDYVALTQAVIDASNQYIFTSEEADMVLQRVEDLGTEEYEGQESQKYEVEVNKTNLKKYLVAVRDNIEATGVVEKLSSETNLTEEISDSDIDEFVDDADFSDVKIEAWVGLNNKVLRNIRFTPTDEPTSYVDVSLLLDDDSLEQIPLRIRIAGDDDESSGKVDINWTVNTTANSGEFSVDADIDYKSEFDSDIKMDARLSFNGLAEEPALQVPTPSESFVDFVLGVGNQVEDVLGITTDTL